MPEENIRRRSDEKQNGEQAMKGETRKYETGKIRGRTKQRRGGEKDHAVHHFQYKLNLHKYS